MLMSGNGALLSADNVAAVAASNPADIKATVASRQVCFADPCVKEDIDSQTGSTPSLGENEEEDSADEATQWYCDDGTLYMGYFSGTECTSDTWDAAYTTDQLVSMGWLDYSSCLEGDDGTYYSLGCDAAADGDTAYVFYFSDDECTDMTLEIEMGCSGENEEEEGGSTRSINTLGAS